MQPHASQENDAGLASGSGGYHPYHPLHHDRDRVANLKTASTSGALDFSPQQFGLPLSVRTSKKTKASALFHNAHNTNNNTERPQAAPMPRSHYCCTPQHLLLNSPLQAFDESAFIIDDGNLYPLSSARFWTSADLDPGMGSIKEHHYCGEGGLPNTSTFASLMQGGAHMFAAFNTQPSDAMRPALADPVAVQKFLQTAQQLQRRAQLLQEAEAYEVERAKRLKCLHPPQHPAHTSALLDSPDAHHITEAGSLGQLSHLHLLGSPSIAFLSWQQQQHFLSSPMCFAEVRLLDSKNNTPTKYAL